MWTFFEGITFQQPWSSFHGLVPTLKFNKYSRYPKKIFQKKALFQTISFSSHVEFFGVPPMLLKHIIHSSYCLLLSYLPRNSVNPKKLPRFASGLQNHDRPPSVKIVSWKIQPPETSWRTRNSHQHQHGYQYGIMAASRPTPRVGWPAIRDNAHQARGLSPSSSSSWLHGNLKGPNIPSSFSTFPGKNEGIMGGYKALKKAPAIFLGKETWHWLGVWGGCWAP